MRLSAAVVCAGSLALLAPSARADLIAAVDQPSPAGTDSDIALYDFSTGTRLSLPAGVNTSAGEFHPSLDASGRRLVFQRTAPDGSRRIIMVDRSTGQLSDLFSVTEAATLVPSTPTITPDGTTVFTGRHDGQEPNGDRISFVERVDVRAFPATSYPKTGITGFAVVDNGPNVLLPSFNPSALDASRVAWVSSDIGSPASDPLNGATAGLGEPTTIWVDSYHVALDPANPGLAVIDPAGASGVGSGDLRVVNLTGGATFSQGSPLTVTNTTSDESRPAFTRDGRYMAFMRKNSLGDHLHVIDTLQGGAEVAPYIKTSASAPALAQIRSLGNVSLFLSSTLFKSTSLSSSGVITSSLSQTSPVGILVQRIVGHRALLGDVQPVVKTVGRFPFGRQRKGRLHLRWNFTVNGRRLKRGRYLITLRALDRKSGRPRDLAKPVVLHIRR